MAQTTLGHLKADHRMKRNHYQGQSGDAINAHLGAAGFNLRTLLAFFLRWIQEAFSAFIFAGRKSNGKKYAFNIP